MLLFSSIPRLAIHEVDAGTEIDYWIELEHVAGGLELPLQVVDPDDGSGRLFIVEKPGVIRILRGGAVEPEPFLDISERTQSPGFEEGLFSIAPAPDFAESGVFYIAYSHIDNEWRLERMRVSDDPDVANPESAEVLISIDHPEDTHWGGMTLFGPDGNLWVGLGDGGGAFDPLENGQNPGTLLGSIIRIDPSRSDGDLPYAIPDDNPFVGRDGYRPEIWAYGLRNPWRFSFDRETGDLYIADVGQNRWEEVNVVPAGPDGIPEGGQNFGWPEMEGMQCSERIPNCDPALYEHPIAQYNHFYGCSVTGGYVDRSNPESPSYGDYLFADFCEGTIWAMTEGGDGTQHAEQRVDTTLVISSFAEDTDGNVYITDIAGGDIYRVRTTRETPAPVVVGFDPLTALAGTVGCVIEIRGWNFLPDASVTLAGEEQPATYVDDTQLEIPLSSGDLADPGTLDIGVINGLDAAVVSTETELRVRSGIADRAVYDRWERADGPVAAGEIARTWTWGPQGLACAFEELYAEAPGGSRVVQYFDKSRMEVTDPAADPDADWYVTNGLLVNELVTGRMQTGDSQFEEREQAEINVAGDLNDETAPTYQTFATLLDAQPSEVGEAVTQRVDRDGSVSTDPDLAGQEIEAAYFVPETEHTVAGPFWEFMTGNAAEAGYESPFYTTGLPITEAYWATVNVGGEPRDVLMQLFERRVLTYTPDNPTDWQVESGNVGQHYFIWRYGWDALPAS